MQTTQHTLKFNKKERLKSEIIIADLFRLGKSRSHDCVRMVYLYPYEELPFEVQVMFSVPKKNFKKAINRNLLKRRMREAYRLNKFELINFFTEKEIKIVIAFLYIDIEIKSYSEIEKSVKYLLKSLLTK